MQLGNNIQTLRKKKGLSQEKLAEKINVTRQTISNWELGETAPNPEQLILLSKQFDISIDELVGNDIKTTLLLLFPEIISQIDCIFNKLCGALDKLRFFC